MSEYRYCDKCVKKIVKCTRYGTQPASSCGSYEEKASAGDVPEIRKFETGATRDTVEGKLSYAKALSPIVIQRYVQYLADHRKQPDGSVRDFNNWKKGIPVDVYLDGLKRHVMACWLLHDGFSAKDNHGVVNLEESLAAVIFNSMGWLHEILKEKLEK